MVYEGGRERFYLLSELPADQCVWGADNRSWRLGDSTFGWTDTPAGGGVVRTLRADLDLALPTGGRVSGELCLSGPLRRDASVNGSGQAEPSSHQWAPMLAACRGFLELRTPSGELRVDGRGYHDRNSAEHPLHGLGIQSWWWGRLALPGRDLIFYRLSPSAPGAPARDLLIEVADDGACRVRENAGLQVGRLRRTPWGLRWPSSVAFADLDGRPVAVEVEALFDNGPFYQRYLLRGRCGESGLREEEGYGMGENVVPDRVDSDLLRPLVRMRVHRTEGPNSMWLPLFSGDSEGRVRRLLGLSGEVRA